MSRAAWISTALSALALPALGFLLFFPEMEITNYPSSGSTVVAFGDSLVEGVGSTEGNDLPSLLSASIGEPVINLGKSGDTTAAALSRVDAVLAEDPKVVLVLLGGNDYLRKTPREETRANLEEIVRRLQDRGAVVLLLGVRGGLLRDGFESMFESVAEKYRTAYVSDVLDGLIGNREFMSDQIHPNDAGYREIAKRVAPVLAGLIR